MAEFEKKYKFSVPSVAVGLEHTILQSWGQRSDQLSYYRERTQLHCQIEVLDGHVGFR